MQPRWLPITCRLAVVVGLVVPACQAAEAQHVRLINVHAGWGGLGPPQKSDVTIAGKEGKFVCEGKPVIVEQVQALINALFAPRKPKPDMANLGITEAWLNANVASQNPRVPGQATRTTGNQRALLTHSFTNPALIANVLPTLFSFIRTDDYPFVHIDVVFDDGSKVSAGSGSSYVFMIPWRVNGHDGDTYNADISRALSVLLPTGTANKPRLMGDDLLPQLVDAVMRSIEAEWKRRGSEDLAGDALTSLRREYEVVASDIHSGHHPEYGTATYKGEPQEMNLHLTLRKASFPLNLTDTVVLRYVNGKSEGVEQFLNRVGKYEAMALSVPWLSTYMREHPSVAIRISYVHDQSMGDKAMRTFAEDMKARGREDLTQVVRAQQSQIVLLITGMMYFESYWLLFPDKHMMLWRYGGASGLLKWTPADFSPGLCGEYRSNFGGCSGREVSADGELGPEHTPRDQVCMALHRTVANSGIPAGDQLFPVMDRDRAGFIDRTGKVVIPLCFDKAGSFSEGLARFERDGKWGYIDTAGTVVIEPKFPWAREFSEGLAQVQVTGSAGAFNGRWGFIDRTGNVVISPNFKATSTDRSNTGSDDDVDAFHDGLAKVDVDGKSGFIDKTGALIISPQFRYAYPFSQGFAAVTKSSSGSDGWGYIDRAGNWAIAPQFEWASSFGEDLAPVNGGGECVYIDRKGTITVKPPMPPVDKDCATMWGTFVDGLSRWRFGRKYGYIDRTGKVVIKPEFDLTYQFSEGVAAVKVGDKWGYIDRTGRMVIKPMRLTRAEDFHHGLAFVNTKDGRYGYIDKKGNDVWRPTFLYKN